MSHTGPILEGLGDTDYERYIRTVELLALQKKPEELIHPEEHLFQVTHQTAEIWLKHIDYEVARIEGFLSSGELHLAADVFHRCAMLLDLLRQQIVVLETMAPADYHVIRVSSLGRGSGQESPGFKRLLGVGKRLWPLFEEVLEKSGLTLVDIQRKPREHYAMFRLVEMMMDYDAAFMKWRFTHLRLAMRVIGFNVNSLKGVPVHQLEAGTREALFPRLWDAIGELTAEFKPTY